MLRATKLIQTGEVIELGNVLNSTMPFFGTLEGVEMLADNYEIPVQDIQQALARQKLKLKGGTGSTVARIAIH